MVTEIIMPRKSINVIGNGNIRIDNLYIASCRVRYTIILYIVHDSIVVSCVCQLHY